jgi:hypothetical protein
MILQIFQIVFAILYHYSVLKLISFKSTSIVNRSNTAFQKIINYIFHIADREWCNLLQSENNGRSAGSDIPLLLWISKIHYRVHKSPPLVSVLSQMVLVHILTPYFCNIHLNVILPSTIRSRKCSLTFSISHIVLSFEP